MRGRGEQLPLVVGVVLQAVVVGGRIVGERGGPLAQGVEGLEAVGQPAVVGVQK